MGTLCAAPRCGATAISESRCYEHRRQLPSSTARGYDATYERLRLTVLIAHPICQVGLCTERSAEADHIKPLNKGGTNTLDNLQALCRHHNRSKGAKVMAAN